MCYFSSISVGFKIIEDRFGASFIQTESFKPVYSASGFSFPSLPVITNEDNRYIVLLRWGLIPFWVKSYDESLAIRQRTLNARSETIFTKPAFRHAIISKRSLVLADGFFEWKHENNKTYPYYIRLKNRAPFAFAGIWDIWTNPDTQEQIRTYSVITTRANSLLEKIHNTKKRMPVILPREQEEVWLQKDLKRDKIQSLLQPYNSDEMEAFPVPRLVNKLGLNTGNPEVLARQEYPELSAI
ncbi:SOS response-associated peptidase [Chloroflexota bacterium]